MARPRKTVITYTVIMDHVVHAEDAYGRFVERTERCYTFDNQAEAESCMLGLRPRGVACAHKLEEDHKDYEYAWHEDRYIYLLGEKKDELGMENEVIELVYRRTEQEVPMTDSEICAMNREKRKRKSKT